MLGNEKAIAKPTQLFSYLSHLTRQVEWAHAVRAHAKQICGVNGGQNRLPTLLDWLWSMKANDLSALSVQWGYSLVK